jgi:hypothetical protein
MPHSTRVRAKRAKQARTEYYTKYGALPKDVLKHVVANVLGTLMAKRNKTIAIREAGARRKKVAILYTKLTDRKTVIRILDPYSFRMRRLRIGWKKVFFGFDWAVKNREGSKKRSIKMFYLGNIHSVKILNIGFQAQWLVEFP